MPRRLALGSYRSHNAHHVSAYQEPKRQNNIFIIRKERKELSFELPCVISYRKQHHELRYGGFAKLSCLRSHNNLLKVHAQGQPWQTFER